MKHVLVLIASFLMSTIAHSQADGTTIDHSPLASAIALGSLSIDKYSTVQLQYDDIKGSPYLEKDLLSGYIVLLDGGKTPQVPLQFDLYGGIFFYTDPNGDKLTINLKVCREIILQGKQETYQFKRTDPNTADTFYDVLYEDDQLFIYNRIETILREGSDNGIVKTEPSFNRDNNYYVLIKGGKPKSIKLKKKDVFKLFSKSDQAQMEAFVKQNKLKLKKEAEFKEMFKSLTQKM